MTTVFLSYATPDLAVQRDRLCDSAAAVGFDRVLRMGPEDIQGSTFWQANAGTLSQPRGAGYWLWKPYLIAQVLTTLRPDDLLVYCDAGRNDFHLLTGFPARLATRARAAPQGFLLGPLIAQHGPLAHWTKRDCLHLMGMDRPDILRRPMVQATWSFWTPSAAAHAFLAAWQAACEDPRCLTDAPNTLGLPDYPGFTDHRHDQSVLTLLAYRHDAAVLDFSDTVLFRLLALRPQSELAHRFLKRIDDGERMLAGRMVTALLRAFVDLRRNRRIGGGRT